MDGTVKYRNKETLIDRILSAPDLLHGKPLDAVYLKPLRLGKISFISCFFTYLFVFSLDIVNYTITLSLTRVLIKLSGDAVE